MPDYILNNPAVAAAVLTGTAALVAMLVASRLHFRFVCALRTEARPFWDGQLGGTTVGLALVPLDLSPASVSRLTNDPAVTQVCDRFARPCGAPPSRRGR